MHTIPSKCAVTLLIGTVVSLVLFPSMTHAEESDTPSTIREARERVTRGEALYRQGDYDSALVEFQQAYDVIGEHPNRYLVLFNIGRCHHQSFRYDQALRFYRQYLEEGGDGAPDRADVEALIEELETLLGTLRVEIDIESAEVWLDNRSIGTAPGSLSVPSGVHTIELRAPGHVTARHRITVAAGSEELLIVTMERLPETFDGLHPAYFWTGLGLTLASGIATAILGITTVRDHNDVESRLDSLEEQWNVTQGEVDSVQNLALATDVMLVTTSIFAIATVVFALITNWELDEDSAETATQRNRFDLAIGVFGPNFSLGGRF